MNRYLVHCEAMQEAASAGMRALLLKDRGTGHTGDTSPPAQQLAAGGQIGYWNLLVDAREQERPS
jgi:hypothetical protein